VLFGSTANGSDDEQSDVDVLVAVSDASAAWQSSPGALACASAATFRRP
jgi:hypothetical protein